MLTITKRIKKDHKKGALKISKANSNMSLYGIKIVKMKNNDWCSTGKSIVKWENLLFDSSHKWLSFFFPYKNI